MGVRTEGVPAAGALLRVPACSPLRRSPLGMDVQGRRSAVPVPGSAPPAGTGQHSRGGQGRGSSQMR